MVSKEIKSGLILTTLMAGCARTASVPESPEQTVTEEPRAPLIVPAPESFDEELGENQAKVFLTDDTGFNICSSTNPNLGGSFFRVNGEIEFYLFHDRSNTRFIFPKGIEFAFDDGLIISDNQSDQGNDNPDNLYEDFIQIDTSKWIAACPAPPPIGDPAA